MDLKLWLLLFMAVYAILVAPTVAQADGSGGTSLARLSYTHCVLIEDPRSRSYCLDYINGVSSDEKWTTAVLWAKYRPGSFKCANIDPYCLVADMRAEAYGSTCPAPVNGSPCPMPSGTEGSCLRGTCRDPAEVAVSMLLLQDGIRPGEAAALAAAAVGGHSSNASFFQVAAPSPPSAAPGQQQQQQQQRQPPGDYEYDPSGNGSGGGGSGSSPPLPPPADPYGLDVQLPPTPLISGAFAPRPPVSPPPVPPPPPTMPTKPSRAQLTMDIQPDAFVGAVPAAFVGISREWTPAVYWDRNLPAFGALLAELGPAPVLRIGGASQEALLRPPNATFMSSLVALHCALGVRYVVGLPLFQNAPELSLAVMRTFDAAFADYPYAILSYELGNEPNYWPGTREGGFTPIRGATTCAPVNYNSPGYELVGTIDAPSDAPGGAGQGFALYRDAKTSYVPYLASAYCFTPQNVLFVPGVDSYLSYFTRAARTLTGCGGLQSELQALWGFPYWGPPGFNRRIISGPAWGDFSGTLNITSFAMFLRNSEGCYLSESTMHYYGPNRNTTFDKLFDKLTGLPNPTLPPGPSNKALITIVKDYVDAARAANVGLRVSEANSIPDGGQGNFSNTLGAAIWTLVTSMEFARAGASGINFHWGNGGIPSDPRQAPAYVGAQTMFGDPAGGNPVTGDPSMPYPSPRIPWYGYVMFARALGGNGPGLFLNYSTNALAPGAICNEYFYTYALLVPHAGMVSIVAANANPNVTCDFTATLPGVLTTGGVLQRLVGPAGMYSVPGVTLAGQTYQGTYDGRMQGTYAPELIQPHQETMRTTGWTFSVPAGSAALLQVPLTGGASDRIGYPPISPALITGGSQQAAPAASAAWAPPTAEQAIPTPTRVEPGLSQAVGADLGTMESGAAVGDIGASSTEPAGSYVLKGYGPGGSPIYTWRAATATSAAYGQGEHLLQQQMLPVQPLESAPSTAPGRFGGLFSGLLGRGRALHELQSAGSSQPLRPAPRAARSLLGLGHGGFEPHALQQGATMPVPQMVLPPMPGYSGVSGYGPVPGVDMASGAAPGSAASQFGAPALPGVGRVWPKGANTTVLDVGLYGLGGYTLLPPGYNVSAVNAAAARCPGIARIQQVDALANTPPQFATAV